MREQLEKIREEALNQIEASEALEKLNEIRVAYLGKKGELTNLLKGMKNVAPEDRTKVGQMVNEVREQLENRLEEGQDRACQKGQRRTVKARGYRRDPARPKEQGRAQPSQHHRTGRGEADLRGYGLRGSGRPRGEVRPLQLLTQLNIPKGHPARDKLDPSISTTRSC